MKVFQYDTVRVILNTGKDVSSFTTLLIKWEDPDGDDGRWVATLNGSSDLKIQATVQFNKPGRWRVQAYVWKAGPEYYHGRWAEIRVYKALSTTTTVAPTTAAPTTAP